MQPCRGATALPLNPLITPTLEAWHMTHALLTAARGLAKRCLKEAERVLQAVAQRLPHHMPRSVQRHVGYVFHLV